MTKHVVARKSDLPEGSKMRVMAGRRALCLVNSGGEFFAVSDRCPHGGASLAGGIMSGIVESDGPGNYRLCRRGEMIKCPWHGWEFDVRTGQSWSDPADTKVRAYETETVEGTDLVRGPYVAETVEVTVDGDYIVVDC